MAYVYVIEEIPHAGELSGPWTKIGYTKNPPEWRLGANLTRGNSRTLRVAAEFQYENERAARDAERAAHDRFRDRLHQKEWFNISWKEAASWLKERAKTIES